MKLIDALPRSELDVTEGMIQLPEPNLAVSEKWMREFYGDIMDAELPISDEIYNQILEMSTPAWKDIWQKWKADGLFN